ncbi:2Fe-2S iron-sulfur cluster-binding protein [Streptomyces sp. B1I3]|uniref:2Fe-2S iron-sulfur cluster-binding protein n=1 Tax=Streptomyces sp. B1I3 TaxID=3042264 RepID=UPI0027893772|nr:2Fe-2S iron-sulfur cluster-binding protein [Streptomyces sp. B1I3]MDQ0796099.1 aerobic-type carbon monoxide dehydrogenase small subunit (CoxS/CutS family) [Streptomyces sp. B1I3]
MSQEENPEQHGQPDPYGGWQPIPQGGEYDAEATAFVHLPPEDLANLGGVPLAAPGQGYVPPMILPLTPAAGLDPAATGSWVMQTQSQQEHADRAAGAEAVPEAVHWPDPNSTHETYQQHHPDTSQYGQTSSTTAQWHFAEAEPAAPAPEPVPEPLGHTGQWTIPVADGDLPEESGEYAASAMASQWYADTPPATLPGGAPAPWATPEPTPAPEEPSAASEPEPPRPEPEAGQPVAGSPEGMEGAGSHMPGSQLPESQVHESQVPESQVHESQLSGEAREVAPTDVPGQAPDVPEGAEDPDAGSAQDARADAPGELGEADAPGDAPEPAGAHEQAAVSSTDAGHPGHPEDAIEVLGVPDAAPDRLPDTAPVPTDAPSEHPAASYVLHVNGADRPVSDAWIGESLLYVLRERLGLAGAKDGCSQGECGACNVQVDGRLVASCLVPAATAAGSEVRTVEGLAVDGEPSDVQRALAECGAVQCGFCIPGMAMTVHDLLEGNHAPTELETRQALCGNLCRCSGYRGVLDAVREVVAGREATVEAASAADDEPRVPHQAPPGAGGVQSHAHEGDIR